MAKTNTGTKIFQCQLRPYRHTLALTSKGESLKVYEQSRQLTEAKKELPDILDCNRNVQTDVLKRLDLAFDAFFRRLQEPGVKAGCPRCKGPDRCNSFSQQIDPRQKCPLNGDKLFVPGVGSCRVRLSRPIAGKVKQLPVTGRASGWYVCLVCEIPRSAPLPATGLSVGIDAGINDFATLSNGEAMPHPRHLNKAAGKLKLAQQRLARKTKGSANRQKARWVVALKHERVANCRNDFHHKVSHDLVKRFDTIKVEALNIRGLVQNHYLAQAINDVAGGDFFQITKAKAENAGRTFAKVNPANTSQTCSGCGARQKMPLSVRVFSCAICHRAIYCDHNAAINILGRGAPSKPGEWPLGDCEAGNKQLSQ